MRWIQSVQVVIFRSINTHCGILCPESIPTIGVLLGGHFSIRIAFENGNSITIGVTIEENHTMGPTVGTPHLNKVTRLCPVKQALQILIGQRGGRTNQKGIRSVDVDLVLVGLR